MICSPQRAYHAVGRIRCRLALPAPTAFPCLRVPAVLGYLSVERHEASLVRADIAQRTVHPIAQVSVENLPVFGNGLMGADLGAFFQVKPDGFPQSEALSLFFYR